MATKSNLPISAISAENSSMYNRIRSIIETSFYRNNVIQVKTIKEAYELAKNSPGTIVTDQEVYKAKELGLPDDAKVLIFNDGNITGRQAKLRHLINPQNTEQFADLLREVIYSSKNKKMYHGQVYVGLDKEFMVRAHMLIPEGYENTLYSWLLNFQIVDEEYTKMYKDSKIIEEGDIYIYSDPDMFPKDFEKGLALFDADHNCACLLGMRYFGEHKKGTLTLGWSIAERNGYTACHGGQKRFNLDNNKVKIIGVFGLSGSGKSTITFTRHGGRLDTTILHDDAFIISNQDASSICLEQSFFDKTQDYPLTEPQSKFCVTIQNCGATIDEDGRVVQVTEDIQSGNGRTIKSKYASENREYRFTHPCDAFFWIMKDNSLPPVIKITSPELGAVLGATLSTKRSNAEFNVDANQLVFVPYGNPFRLYPLAKDYNKFKQLFSVQNIDCYIINTGYFMEKKVTKRVTFTLIEEIINETAKFKSFGPFTKLEYLSIEGYEPDFNNRNYVTMVKNRMLERLAYVNELDEYDRLPEEALNAMRKVVIEIS